MLGIVQHQFFTLALRLNFSALNYDLFKKNCTVSTVCIFCDAPIEDAKHYFLYCQSFAALRDIVFASAEHLLGDRWLLASDKKTIDWILNGVSSIYFQINVNLFQSVQSFISQSNRFSLVILFKKKKSDRDILNLQLNLP